MTYFFTQNYINDNYFIGVFDGDKGDFDNPLWRFELLDEYKSDVLYKYTDTVTLSEVGVRCEGILTSMDDDIILKYSNGKEKSVSVSAMYKSGNVKQLEFFKYINIDNVKSIIICGVEYPLSEK